MCYLANINIHARVASDQNSSRRLYECLHVALSLLLPILKKQETSPAKPDSSEVIAKPSAWQHKIGPNPTRAPNILISDIAEPIRELRRAATRCCCCELVFITPPIRAHCLWAAPLTNIATRIVMKDCPRWHSLVILCVGKTETGVHLALSSPTKTRQSADFLYRLRVGPPGLIYYCEVELRAAGRPTGIW